MLCSNPCSQMATYCSASILSSTSLKIHIPFHPMQPYTISEPPPNLTVSWTSLAISPSSFLFHTYSCPSDPILLILVSSDHITLFQSSTVLYLYLRAKANLLFLWPLERSGFFFFTSLWVGFLDGISHNLRTDRSINDGIDILSGMNSILGLTSNHLLNNSCFIGRGKLQRIATMKSSLLWLEFLKNLAYCRLF